MWNALSWTGRGGCALPELYDRHLVPLIFDAYAPDLVARLRSPDIGSILEVAAGTGAVTRAMTIGLPASVSITATDLSQSMIDYARSVGTSRPVVWQTADVMDLPFRAASFDAVVCQFGVMFFPDRPAAFAEVARVLRPGGVFLFNVWDAIEYNEFAAVVTAAVGSMFPDDPPLFLERTPSRISTNRRSKPMSRPVVSYRRRVSQGWRLGAGHGRPRFPRSPSAQGTPLRNEIEARFPSRLAEATEVAAVAIEEHFGKPMSTGRSARS